jgi:hypothetical protein
MCGRLSEKGFPYTSSAYSSAAGWSHRGRGGERFVSGEEAWAQVRLS